MTRATRVTVVGDTLLDLDWIGSVERISPDAPAPVLDADEEQTRPGGAGQAALHAAAQGADVTLVTALGDDADGALVHRALQHAGVAVIDLGLDGPTPSKLRLRDARGATIGRVDRNSGRPPAQVGGWSTEATQAVEQAQAVLVSDYGRGIAGVPALLAVLLQVADQIAVVWDPHPRGPRPPTGLPDLLTPNLSEATRLVGDEGGVGGSRADDRCSSVIGEVMQLAERMQQQFDCAVAVTAGEQGAVLAQPGSDALTMPVEPANGDTCGAGDSFAASVAVERARGASRPEAVARAVEAARRHVAGSSGVAVGAPGQSTNVVPVGRLSPVSPARARHEAITQVESVRRVGGTVVAAGGCFDVVHAGHVRLLEMGRRLGDCLVVCVNSDDSTRRLKGPPRPVNPIEDRIAVLRSLSWVDAVAVFDEDTPCELLEELRPDLFVKGADHADKVLPEREVMAGWGGRVVLLPVVAGRSTTRILHAVAAG